ncbi:MAG: 4-hydroxy-3-methylbut-2-enyl diphosphate reductase [Bacteroidales bacterium]|jgi:4-hydroxy-3-methylbut-2-enyl diphosphate reductase|nr:4-hydroxy-3-methylbut-2-enyl diphosphate reductase [Bacteroidales bacterium]
MDSPKNKNIIDIDASSGFCFGVVNAIKKAEKTLEDFGSLYCLGDIVHNGAEVERLQKKGLQTIDYVRYFSLSDCTVLLRAHGEPPAVYEHARKNNITIIDATCPVVLQLQKKIHKGFEKEKRQIIIFGTHGHAEVVGLLGQTNNTAIVINKEDDLAKIDFSRPISLYSQTTKNLSQFKFLAEKIKEQATDLKVFDTICRQVSNREQEIREFARKYDIIVFVSGEKSSNGKVLYSYCTEENKDSFFVSNVHKVKDIPFSAHQTIGICGATSTPRWLMDEVSQEINRMLEK